MTTQNARTRKTAVPWYIRQAEYDGVAIILRDRDLIPRTHSVNYPHKYLAYAVQWTNLLGCGCGLRHTVKGDALMVEYNGDSLAEAEAAYAELEAKLIAGELHA